MTTFAINTTSGASTQYTEYGFLAMCRGHDGNYYGIKADGLYLLEGKADSFVDFGDHTFGTSAEKMITAAYGTYASEEPLNLLVTQGEETYEYPARSVSDTINTHRFDTGRGLRHNVFGLAASNTEGAYFTLESAEVAVQATTRRI